MSAPELREPPVQPVSADAPPLVPARMVNEFVYCPRLAYLEWVQGEWVESSDTVEGRHAHRRVNRDGGKLPPPADVDKAEKLHARSVTLSSDRLGLIARMDLIESDGGSVTPVDYKRGKRPHVERGAYDPERVQLCVQGLLLREHGYVCDEGVLYFVGSRERVRVPFAAPPGSRRPPGWRSPRRAERECAPAETPGAPAAAAATTARPSHRRRPPCRDVTAPRTDTARIHGRSAGRPAAAGSTSCRNTR